MNKKALIIFARQPVPGKTKTRLTPPLPPHKAAELYHLMLTDILDRTAQLQGTDRILFYAGGPGAERFFRDTFPGLPSYPQQGEDLGRRMESAFARVFAMGYRSVAVIGTDSPDLPLAHIEEGFRLLEDGEADVVFGPAEDGGYYLLAMNGMNGGLFHGIAWSSEGVLRESIHRAGRLGLRAATLPVWHDVDTFEDLKRPELRDGDNLAPLTRGFLERLGDFIR